MEEENIAIRLKGFIQSQGLTNSQFADNCGIARPSLSQLLGGRNKKMSDVMMGQIHKAYPELSVVWLMFGEGQMLTGNDTNPDELLNPDNLKADEDANLGHNGVSDSDMHVDELNSVINYRNSEKFSNFKGLSKPVSASKYTDTEKLDYEIKNAELLAQIDKMRKNPRKVSQITIYYDDSTFETFYPKR